jgi:hypothetical protein
VSGDREEVTTTSSRLRHPGESSQGQVALQSLHMVTVIVQQNHMGPAFVPASIWPWQKGQTSGQWSTSAPITVSGQGERTLGASQ